MKVKVDDGGFRFEREPMELERFNALCRLARDAIAGAVFLGAVYMGTGGTGGRWGVQAGKGIFQMNQQGRWNFPGPAFCNR